VLKKRITFISSGRGEKNKMSFKVKRVVMYKTRKSGGSWRGRERENHPDNPRMENEDVILRAIRTKQGNPEPPGTKDSQDGVLKEGKKPRRDVARARRDGKGKGTFNPKHLWLASRLKSGVERPKGGWESSRS